MRKTVFGFYLPGKTQIRLFSFRDYIIVLQIRHRLTVLLEFFMTQLMVRTERRGVPLNEYSKCIYISKVRSVRNGNIVGFQAICSSVLITAYMLMVITARKKRVETAKKLLSLSGEN